MTNMASPKQRDRRRLPRHKEGTSLEWFKQAKNIRAMRLASCSDVEIPETNKRKEVRGKTAAQVVLKSLTTEDLGSNHIKNWSIKLYIRKQILKRKLPFGKKLKSLLTIATILSYVGR